MTTTPITRIRSTHYHADVHCALIEGFCGFRSSGPDARMHAINHTKLTGHTTIARIETTEEIKLA